ICVWSRRFGGDFDLTRLQFHRVFLRFKSRSVRIRIDLCELGAKKKDLARVKNPDEQGHQGTGRTVSGCTRSAGQIEAEKEFTYQKEDGGQSGARPNIPPGDL